jgi:hypothetical protein
VFGEILAKNCGITYDVLQKRIRDSTDSKEIWMSPADALAFGLVDKIGVPELVPVIQWACDTRPEKQRLNLQEQTAKKKPTKKRK